LYVAVETELPPDGKLVQRFRGRDYHKASLMVSPQQVMFQA
jgi:hypothetical protein